MLRAGVGFILDKKISTNCPKVMDKAKILIANTCLHSSYQQMPAES